MNPCVDLAMPFTPDLQHLIPTLPELTEKVHIAIHSKVDWVLKSWLALYGLEVASCNYFYTPPNQDLPPHIDFEVGFDVAKLNFVYGGEGSTMRWWQTANLNRIELVTTAGTKYVRADMTGAKLLYECAIGRPSLMSGGTMHSVHNAGNPRHALSFTMVDLKTKRLISYPQAIEKLKSCIK